MPTGLGDEQLWLSATNDNTGTSTAFNDQSGQGNNGTATGTLVVADTSEGGSYAYSLNGSQAVINSTLDLRTLTQFSFSVWFKSTSTSGSQMIFSYGNPTSHSTETALVHLRSSDLLMQVDGKSGIINTLPTINAWHHLSFVVDGNNPITTQRMLMYLDGQLIGSPSVANVTMYNPAAFACNLGSLNGVSNFGLIGLADDFRVYQRVLTQAEITHLATSRGVLGPPGGATHYHPFINETFENKSFRNPRF